MLASLRQPPLVVAQTIEVSAPPDSLQPLIACAPVDLVARR